MTPEDKQRILAKVLAALTDDEKRQLLEWSQRARNIQGNTALSLPQRLKQLQRLETSPLVFGVLRRLFRELKVKAWDERSWPVRLGVGGLALGTAVFGGQSIGIAAFGSAVGVSLALVSGMGGTFLGLLISHLEKETGKSEAPEQKQVDGSGR